MTTFKTPAPDAPAAEWGRLATQIPDWRWPDGVFGFGLPIDHWAWEGWLLRLLSADDRPVSATRMSPVAVTVWRHGLGTHTEPTLGRACIAAAAALGRWPGGEQ